MATWFPPDPDGDAVVPQRCEVHDISVTGALIVAPSGPPVVKGTSVAVETDNGLRFAVVVRSIRSVTGIHEGRATVDQAHVCYGVELDDPAVADRVLHTP